jgi:isoquinoline 1-oxidoreductase beta subunit
MTTMTSIKNTVSRRSFLQGAGGLTFAVALGAGGVQVLTPAQARAAARQGQMSTWVRIAADNTITILTPGAEMGQGSMTSVPLILAEELDADWDKVVLENAPADPKTYGYTRMRRGRISHSMAIVGSRAVMMYYKPMRTAGAQVRKVLLQAAAKKWGVPASQLKTEPSVVIGPDGKRLTYGEIAAFADVPDKMPAVTPGELKKPANFRLIGKPLPRRDIPGKVDGSAQFAMDIQLPGMVYATTVHAPVQGAKPISWNEDKLKSLKGYIGAVKLKEGVAVIADNFEHVMAARTELQVKWSKGKAAGYDSETALMTDYPKKSADPKTKAKKVDKKGDTDKAFSEAGKVYKAEYRCDYGYHAQMEPLNAVARINEAGDQIEIWEGTQAPGRSRQGIAKALGFKTAQVIHNQMYMGGGFGRRSRTDYTIEAALVSKQIKKPVKMIWTREEDINYGMFRPQSFQHLEAALDKSGKLNGWKHSVIGDGRRLLTGGAKISKYYKVPNQNIIEQSAGKHGIRTKHWRAVAHVFNVYAIEALIDEVAAAQGMDPLEFRLKNVPLTAKARRVLEKVAQMSDWGKKRPAGRALGLSMTERSGSLGAQVAEVSVDRRNGKIRVHKVWTAVDGGVIVQPEAARRNVESGIHYGLSSVLKERATIKDGSVQQSNFHDYEVLRMAESPEEVHVEFLDRSTKPTGLGEIGNPGIASAVANGFYALTGKRLYHMPFTPARVLEALKA